MEFLADREFWVAVAFVIAIAIIVVKGGPIIGGALDGRAAKIKSALDEATELREEAQRTLADYQRKQREALDEAKEILRKAETEAARLAAKAESDLAASLVRREALAKERIARAEVEAVNEVRAAAVTVAIAASKDVLIQSLDYARGVPLIDAAIHDLPQRLTAQ